MFIMVRRGGVAVGMTMTAKILARAAGLERAAVGEVLLPKVSLLTCPDGTTFIDDFNRLGLRVWDPTRILFCFDHNFQPEWMSVQALVEHPKIRDFARRQGIPSENVFDLGRNGVSHHVPVEQGWALPGKVCLGLDTQSATMGAVNCFAMPTLWGTNAVLLRGDIWMQVPECVRIEVTGALPEGVTGKDVGYQLLADLRDVAEGRVLEFAGRGLSTLSMDVRMAICNAAVQIGALAMIFPPDEVLLGYLDGRAREPFEPCTPDADADYVATMYYDLGAVVPLVAGPHDVELVRPMTELLGVRIDTANIGSCSSGRLSDLALAARVLHGRHVHPDVRLFVTPISAEVARAAAHLGVLTTLLDAGATLTQPGCGGCYSGNLSPLKLSAGERCISTSVEAMRGRMGSKDAEILLANAAVVAASAVEGHVADPSPYLAETSAVPA